MPCPGARVGMPSFFPVRVLFSVTVLVAGLLIIPFAVANAGAPPRANCDIHAGPCTIAIKSGAVTLAIDPKPVTAMQDLKFRVTLKDLTPEALPYIDLGMPGMKMGPNRVELKQERPGLYRGRGVIVRCQSGKRLWEANVIVPGAGQAAFRFDVVY